MHSCHNAQATLHQSSVVFIWGVELNEIHMTRARSPISLKFIGYSFRRKRCSIRRHIYIASHPRVDLIGLYERGKRIGPKQALPWPDPGPNATPCLHKMFISTNDLARYGHDLS